MRQLTTKTVNLNPKKIILGSPHQLWRLLHDVGSEIISKDKTSHRLRRRDQRSNRDDRKRLVRPTHPPERDKLTLAMPSPIRMKMSQWISRDSRRSHRHLRNHREDQNQSGSHGVFEGCSLARCTRQVPSREDRSPGLRHTQLDDSGELLHRDPRRG